MKEGIGQAIMFCGRKNSSKTTTGQALAERLNYELMDCGRLFEEERKNKSDLGKEIDFWYNVPNFFSDRSYQHWAFNKFTQLGGYSNHTINVGMPRSVFQYKVVESYAKAKGLELKIINLEIDDDTFARRHAKRLREGNVRDFDDQLEKAILLDQQFKKPVELMVDYLKDTSKKIISIPTYQIINGKSIDRPIDDYLTEVLNFING